MTFSPVQLEFENGNKALALWDVPIDANPKEILEAFGMQDFRGVVTLVVAAGRMPEEITDATRELFTKSLAPVAEKLGLLLVDGATRYGGMLAIGDARQAIGGTFPLLGVIPTGTGYLKMPDDLDSSHSHFVLVDGKNFGDESKIIPGFLNATDKPGAVIVVNCRLESPYMLGEFPQHAEFADLIIPIRGSGGVADALLDTETELYKSLPAKALVKGASLDKPEELTALLEELFG